VVQYVHQITRRNPTSSPKFYINMIDDDDGLREELHELRVRLRLVRLEQDRTDKAAALHKRRMISTMKYPQSFMIYAWDHVRSTVVGCGQVPILPLNSRKFTCWTCTVNEHKLKMESLLGLNI